MTIDTEAAHYQGTNGTNDLGQMTAWEVQRKIILDEIIQQ